MCRLRRFRRLPLAVPCALLLGLGCGRAAAQLSPPPPPDHPLTVHGRVEDSSGNPVSSINVELFSNDGILISESLTDPNGDFGLQTNGVSGPYQVEIELQRQAISQSVPLGDPDPEVMVRIPAALLPHRKPADVGDSVSVNDLAVPAKARNRFNDAVKEMNKTDLGHLDRALALIDQALAVAPHWSRALYLRGVIDMNRGQNKDAATDLAAAVAADPHNADAYVAEARLALDNQQPDAADADLRKAIDLSPSLWQAHYDLAQLDMTRGNFAGALQMALAAAGDQPPGPAQCHLLAAQAADKLHNSDTAVIQYRAYLAQTPDPRSDEADAARQRLLQLQAHPQPPAPPPPVQRGPTGTTQFPHTAPSD